MTPLIEKLKERKQSVVDALSAALDAVFLSVSNMYKYIIYLHSNNINQSY